MPKATRSKARRARDQKPRPRVKLAPKNPRKQHPYLVGCTKAEARQIARGARAAGKGPTTWLRELGLRTARRQRGRA